MANQPCASHTAVMLRSFAAARWSASVAEATMDAALAKGESKERLLQRGRRPR